MFDITRRYAADLSRQIGMAASNLGATSDEEKKQIARLELKAEIDPQVWTEIADFVEQMLDVGSKAGTLDKTIREVKDFAKQKQREFEHEQEAEDAVKRRQRDDLSLSPMVQELLQAQQAPSPQG